MFEKTKHDLSCDQVILDYDALPSKCTYCGKHTDRFTVNWEGLKGYPMCDKCHVIDTSYHKAVEKAVKIINAGKGGKKQRMNGRKELEELADVVVLLKKNNYHWNTILEVENQLKEIARENPNFCQEKWDKYIAKKLRR